MGREVVAAVTAADDLELVAAVDPGYAGADLASLVPAAPGITVAGELEALSAAGTEVAVDFTAPSVAQANVEWLMANGIHGVVGTTGLDEAALAAAVSAGSANLLLAANFAIGAVLLEQFAKQAVRFMPNVEVIELHHDQKVDAPSGTASRTAAAIAEARREAGHATPADPTTHEPTPGSRGANVDGVHVHAVRLPGLVAHEEVIFGGIGQTLTIRHDSLDRRSFMDGVLLAVRAVPETAGLTIGLDQLLER